MSTDLPLAESERRNETHETIFSILDASESSLLVVAYGDGSVGILR